MGDHTFEEVKGILRYKYEAHKFDEPKQEKEQPRSKCAGCEGDFIVLRIVFKGRIAYKMYLCEGCKHVPPKPYTEKPNFNMVTVRDGEGNIII